jgi:hypothetical protein
MEGQTTQWPKGQKDKQRSTKHTRNTKDRVSNKMYCVLLGKRSNNDSVTMVKLYDISSEKFTYIVYIFIAIFGSTFYPCICQLIRFDQYFQGSTGLPEGYVIKLFHLIGVSTLFEGAFSHFRLC